MRRLTEAEQTRIADRWKMVVQAETPQRINEIADLEFEAGAHWDPAVKAERERQGKPCLTIDLVSGAIKQSSNQVRASRPGIVVTPLGNGADPKKAQQWQGILRRIENRSNADYAYVWANQHQFTMGRGFWGIIPDFASPDSDEVDFKIRWIDNQHTAYIDPTTKEADKSDARWSFLVDDLTHDDYKDRFSESTVAQNLGQFGSLGDAPPEWLTADRVRVAEYCYVEETSRTRHTLSDGSSVYEDELERGPQTRVKGKFAPGELQFPNGLTSKRTRKIPTRVVKWMLTNGIEALEETVIPGKFIPLIQVEGERRNINGVVDRRGMVRMAKDAQRMENFHESTLVETIATGSKSRWLIEATQREGFEDMWATANRKNWDALVWKASALAPSPPIPVDREPPIQAITIAAQRAQMQVRNIMGNVDVMQEEQRPEVSGRAINARKLQQETQTSDYEDNLKRGIRLTGRILMSMVREGYDTPRLLRITGADEKEYELITHMGPDQEAEARKLMTESAKELLDLSVGEYDVMTGAGKSYASQRQEAVDSMAQLFSAAPQLAMVGADVWVKNMDWPGSQELAARLKKANPLAQEDSGQQQVPPQVQQRLMQLDQYAQMAHDQVAELTKMIDTKQLELASAEKIAAENNATKLELAQIAAGQKDNAEALRADLARMADLIKVLHETRMQHQDHAHETGLAAMTHHQTTEQLREQAVHGAVAADQQHQQGLEAGAVAHGQALEQGEQGHQHAVAQIKAQPKPKPTAGGKK